MTQCTSPYFLLSKIFKFSDKNFCTMGGPYQKNINVSLEIIFGKVDVYMEKNVRYLLTFMIIVLPFVKLFKYKVIYEKVQALPNQNLDKKSKFKIHRSDRILLIFQPITRQLYIPQAHHNSKNASLTFVPIKLGIIYTVQPILSPKKV